VRFEHVFTINMLEGGPELPEMIYMLSREGIAKQALDEYHEQRQLLNRHVAQDEDSPRRHKGHTHVRGSETRYCWFFSKLRVRR